MRIVITGGGTGGHIYPAIAVANEIRSCLDKADILFIGTSNRIEASAVPTAKFPIEFIPAAGFSKKPLKFIKFLILNSLGCLKSFYIIRKFKPQLIIGSGGFVSAPVLCNAAALGVPFILLEQNVYPGKVTRAFSKKAEKVLASYPQTEKYLPKARVVTTGNPVRKQILERTRGEAARILSLSPSLFTLVVMGGSQGARSFNRAVLKSLPGWKDKNWQIIHITGRKNYEQVRSAAEPLLEDFRGEYRCIDFTGDIASVYAICDLLIARAGASTLAEITARGIASILVPYPYAADNHQEKNARQMEEKEAAVVILDDQIQEKMEEAVNRLANEREKLKEMAENAKSMGCPDALDRIMVEIGKTIGYPL